MFIAMITSSRTVTPQQYFSRKGLGLGSTGEVANTFDPMQQFRSMEDLQKMAPKETIFKCHIAPKAFYSAFASDKDNLWYESHLFHSYLDGDGKRKPESADESWGIKPQMKPEYESTGDSFLYLGVQLTRVNLLLRFQDPSCARTLEGHLRQGSRPEGDLILHTFFYSANPAKCADYIEIKKQEAELRWGEREALDLDHILNKYA